MPFWLSYAWTNDEIQRHMGRQDATGSMKANGQKRTSARIGWRFLLGILISLVLLFLAFRQTDPERIWTLILAADRRYLLLAFIFHIAGLGLRAGRWRLLFWRQGNLPYADFLDSVNIGYLVNNLFPVRLGDLVRSVLLGRWLQIGVPRVLSATVLERVLDSALILLLFFSLFLVLPLPAFALNVGLLMALAITVALAFMLLLLQQQARARRWLHWLLSRLPGFEAEKWTERLMGLVHGFGALQQAGALLPFLGWSILVWAQTVLAFWFTMKAFDPHIGLGLAALATAAAALGLAAPSAPAGLGTFEAAVIGALLLSNIDEDVARSMAISLHFLSFLALNFAGFFSLVRRGIGYRHLVSLAENEEAGLNGAGEAS